MGYKQFIGKLNFYMACMVACWMPLTKKHLPIFIALWLLTWLLEGNYHEKLRGIWSKKTLLLLPVFFLLHVIGTLYSENKDAAFFDLEVKLSLLFFPLLFASANGYYIKKYHYLLLSFIVGNLIAVFTCISHSVYNSIFIENGHIVINFYTENYWSHNFLYTTFSILMHPSYFSMYLIFAAIVAVYLLKGKLFDSKAINFTLWVSAPIFVIAVFLNSSRAGIIAFLVIFLIITGRFLIHKIRWIYVVGFLLVFIFSIMIFIINHPRFEEFKKTKVDFSFKEQNPNNSAFTRLYLWKTTAGLIKENLLFGVGTGDVKDRLMRSYANDHYDEAENSKLNAHNEFLETFLRLGIIGFIMLILLFIFPFINSSYYNKEMFVLFIIIVGINFFFESMFNTLSGVVFFAFFYSFIVSTSSGKLTLSSH